MNMKLTPPPLPNEENEEPTADMAEMYELLNSALMFGDKPFIASIAASEDTPGVILEHIVDNTTQEYIYETILQNPNATDYALRTIFTSSVGFPERTAEVVAEHPNAGDETLNAVLTWCEDWYDAPICNIIDHANASPETIIQAANIHEDFFKYAKDTRPAFFQFANLISFSENPLTQRLLVTYFETELREYAEVNCGIDKTLPIHWIMRGLGWVEAD